MNSFAQNNLSLTIKVMNRVKIHLSLPGYHCRLMACSMVVIVHQFSKISQVLFYILRYSCTCYQSCIYPRQKLM